MTNLEIINEKIQEFKKDFEQVNITGYYVFAYSKDENSLMRVSTTKNSKTLSKAIDAFNKTVDAEYIALGVDYEDETGLPCSRDICISRAA